VPKQAPEGGKTDKRKKKLEKRLYKKMTSAEGFGLFADPAAVDTVLALGGLPEDAVI
jgi:hypothetical protein